MIETKIKKRNIAGEFTVQLFVDGIHQKEADYFTNDRNDAALTAADMLKRAAPVAYRTKATARKPLPGMKIYTYSDLLSDMKAPKYDGWNVTYSHSSQDGNTDFYTLYDENGTAMAFPTQVWSDECANLSRKEVSK